MSAPAPPAGDNFTWAPLVPELLVRDLRVSVEFWRDALGFEVAYARPEDGFAYLDHAGAQVMLEQRANSSRQWMTAGLEPPFERGIDLQITVEAVEPILDRLAVEKWPLFMQLEDRWYRVGVEEVGQRQFLVQDPDGYLLRFAQDLGSRPIPA